VGKAGFQRFDGKGVQGPLFDPSVAGPVFYKKGVLLIPSKPWACSKRRGWLALIWRR
jgi:hypothetical protein